MKLLILHGAPASGKLTVGRALAAMTGTPFVDNHAAIDMARMVFSFAKPGFWDLVHDLRVTTLRGAARAGVPRLITTAAYSDPVDAPLLQDYEEAIGAQGGRLEPVHLSCSEQTLMARVTGQDRAAKGKIASQEGLQRYLDQNNFAPMPREDTLCLSTEELSALEVASTIAAHFQLPTVTAE